MSGVLVAQLLIVDRTTLHSAYYFNIEKIAYVLCHSSVGVLLRRECLFFIVRCGAEKISVDTEFMSSGVS
jgi:hypothetical protein